MKLKFAILLAIAISLFSFPGHADAQRRWELGLNAVTQTTSATTGVTLNAPSGVITTVALTNAAGAATSFTVTDTSVKAGSNVQAKVVGYTGTIVTNGIPYCVVDTVANGSFILRVINLGAANALSGAVKVGVLVVN